MTLPTPSTQSVGAAMTRVGSGVAALLFVSAATLIIPVALVLAVASVTHTSWPTGFTTHDLAFDAVTAVVLLLGVSLALVACGRVLRQR